MMHAFFTRRGEIEGRVRSERVHALHQDRVNIRIDRVYPGRQEDARSGRALLMHVIDDLRTPRVENLLDSEPRFGLREAVPVAVVVVADIFVIERDRPGPFIGRAEVLFIPIHD
jgi:hypothetical protein